MRSGDGERKLFERQRCALYLKHPSLDRLTFPFGVVNQSTVMRNRKQNIIIQSISERSSLTFSSFLRQSIFKSVYASETDKDIDITSNDEEENKRAIYLSGLEALSKAYIQQESGWDRVKMMFEKDHKGKTNPELSYIQVALMQVFVLTFFCKYVPVAKFARKEFIREHQATVFRTRFEAIRRLQDHTFMRAGGEAALFSTKVTVFSAAFLLMSSMIASYRNKTSVWEYTAAAGVTGGLARMNMGLKGCFVGALVGSVLGSAVGLIGYLNLSAFNMTQEERHLQAIMAKMEVAKSIEGESGFRDKVSQLLSENKSLATPTS